MATAASLATRCPSCSTVFRVVQDQLRVSEGWVRCGRCSEVFNASQNFVDSTTGELKRPPQDTRRGAAGAPAPEPKVQALIKSDGPSPPARRGGAAAPPPPTVAPTSAPVPMSRAAAPAVAAAPEAKPRAPLRAPPAPSVPVAPTPAPVVSPPAAASSAPVVASTPVVAPAPSTARPGATPPVSSPTPPAAGLRWDDDDEQSEFRPAAALASTSTTIERAIEAAADAPAVADAQAETPGPADAPAADERPPPPDRPPPGTVPNVLTQEIPSFVKRAERAERWRDPRIRAALLAGVLVASLALVVQWMVEYRDVAAARWPSLRPAIAAACSAFGCRIEAARAIDALTVESSGVVRIEKSETYRLSVALKNRSDLDVAVPAFDLSLTDSQGRLIARRMLRAADLGATTNTVRASSDLALQATIQVTAAPVAGYTIELFYP